jgi:hypothetical protein
VTRPHLGLHIGEVFYGDIGSPDRLDFTVVGPAVNEASRIAPMCRSAERGVLLSSAFAAAACEEDRAAFVSVGRYAFRGVGRAHAIHAGTGGRWPQSPRVSLSGEPLQLRSPDMPSWRADSGWIRSLAVDQSIATMAVTGSRPPTAPRVVAFKAPLTPAVDSGR